MFIHLCANTYVLGLLSHYPNEPVITMLYSPHATATYRRSKILEPGFWIPLPALVGEDAVKTVKFDTYRIAYSMHMHIST